MSCVRIGESTAPDADSIAADLHTQLTQPHNAGLLLFAPMRADLDRLAQGLAERFGPVPILGCTTAGGIGPGGYGRDRVVAISLGRPGFALASVTFDDLASFGPARAQIIVEGCLARLRADVADFERRNVFALLMIDGLAAAEERVASSLQTVLAEIPLFGGSAADSLEFMRTCVLEGGRFRSGCAALVLVASRAPFEVFMTQHFVDVGEPVVVTEARPAQRRVLELNGRPAAAEYARLAGVDRLDLGPRVFAARPLAVRVGRRTYLRAIQKVLPDDSLVFYCAIDEGIILSLAKPGDIVANLDHLFTDIRSRIGPPQLVIGCDCVLRGVELAHDDLRARLEGLMAANRVAGFSTFGEQYRAMHMTQTFTGVAIGGGP